MATRLTGAFSLLALSFLLKKNKKTDNLLERKYNSSKVQNTWLGNSLELKIHDKPTYLWQQTCFSAKVFSLCSRSVNHYTLPPFLSSSSSNLSTCQSIKPSASLGTYSTCFPGKLIIFRWMVN